ncbi:MAG: DUF1924 domain-containing protein [Hyphomicrobiaceae bacterium]
MTRTSLMSGIATLLLISNACAALAGPRQDAVLASYAAAAAKVDASFRRPSAARGKAFFHARHTGGKAETPACTSCHTADPRRTGTTRAGKQIAPMAVSVNPHRFTDPAEVEKWFRRNCKDVVGRECSAAEKSDVIAYLTGE